MFLEFATRSEDKIEYGKRVIEQRAAKAGVSIVGFAVKKAADHKMLQHPSLRGIEHFIITGYTSQAELDAVNGKQE